MTDWVQAGRYVAGLDPLTPVGGPTGPSSAIAPLTRSLRGPDGPSFRQVYLSDASLTAGQSGSVKVTLHAQGDETALGFSVAFDPSTVRFVSARLADGVTGATLNLNSQEAAQGRLGFVVGLTGSNRFQAGDNPLVQIDFQAIPTAGGQYSVAFGDSPVFREISDFSATALASVYLNSSVNISPLPPLSITLSGPNLVLSWPSWASAFQLQSADSLSGPWSDVNASVSTANNQTSVAVPIGAGAKLYRLNQR